MPWHWNVHGGVDGLALECSRRPGWFGTGMFTEARMVWHWNVHGGLDGLALECSRRSGCPITGGGLDGLGMLIGLVTNGGARLPFFFLACCLESEA